MINPSNIKSKEATDTLRLALKDNHAVYFDVDGNIVFDCNDAYIIDCIKPSNYLFKELFILACHVVVHCIRSN
jgi:hypothetical protein